MGVVPLGIHNDQRGFAHDRTIGASALAFLYELDCLSGSVEQRWSVVPPVVKLLRSFGSAQFGGVIGPPPPPPPPPRLQTA